MHESRSVSCDISQRQPQIEPWADFCVENSERLAHGRRTSGERSHNRESHFQADASTPLTSPSATLVPTAVRLPAVAVHALAYSFRSVHIKSTNQKNSIRVVVDLRRLGPRISVRRCRTVTFPNVPTTKHRRTLRQQLRHLARQSMPVIVQSFIETKSCRFRARK